MAKAPVAGEVKTRLGATIGDAPSAVLAHAALLDTLAVCEAVFPPGRRVVALAGSIDRSVGPAALRQALTGWDVIGQEGPTLGHRLAAAHRTVHDTHGGPVVQVGMDTPHLTPDHLGHVIATAGTGHPVLGRALDGGWWVLATTSPGDVVGLHLVPMSRPDTWTCTRAAIEAAVGSVLPTCELGDVDTAADAQLVAAQAPDTRFARAWYQLDTTLESRTP